MRAMVRCEAVWVACVVVVVGSWGGVRAFGPMVRLGGGVPSRLCLVASSVAEGSESEDLGGLTREELEALVGRLRGENAALRRSVAALRPESSFSFRDACACAGFAFESYNDPDGARWERGADGCDVAFRDASFVRSCSSGWQMGDPLSLLNLGVD